MLPVLVEDKYYMDGGDREIKQMMEFCYRQGITINQMYWMQADIDLRFKAGDQALWSELYGITPQKRMFTFNKTQKIINMITGYQREHRKSIVCSPIENSDQYTADQLSKVLFWATKRDYVLETISEAYEGGVTCGINLLAAWMDYRHDFVNGELRVDNVGCNSFLIDPYFRKPDLSDCNYLWRRMFMSKSQLRSMFLERGSEIEDMEPRRMADGKFNYMPQSYMCADNRLFTVDEFWYLTTRKQQIIQDIETGDFVEYFGDSASLKEFVNQKSTRITKTIEIPTVKVAYVVDGRVMYNGANPYGHELHPIDRYPFVPVLGYYEKDLPCFSNRLQGVVRGLRDAQYLYNRRKVIELDILESQVNSGWIYEEDALLDPTDVYMTGQGKGIGVKAGRLASVKQIEAPQIPPTMMALSDQLSKDLMEISGVNEELLGAATDDKAGILAMLRQGAGLITLQKLFDQLDYSQKILGEIMIEMIQANFRPYKIERITGEQASPQFRDKAFQRYDVEVEEGMNTQTQKQMQFVQLREVAELGVPITPEDLLEAAQIQNKSKIIENMQKRQEQQAQIEQQQQAIQMEVLKAQINDLQSRAWANQGLGIERASRVEENRSLATQREAQAVSDIAQAKLDKVKALKELEEMDLNQLQILINIINSIKLTDEEAQVKEVDDSKVSSKESNLQPIDNLG